MIKAAAKFLERQIGRLSGPPPSKSPRDDHMAPQLEATETFKASETGPERSCILCGRLVPSWQAFRAGESARSRFMVSVEAVGSNVERFGCPSCGCIDRERHLKLYFDRLGIWPKFRGAAVLHFAPEKRLGEEIAACGLASHVKGDLFPSDPAIQKIDIEHIGFADQSFDFVICNHILEHVSTPRTALAEVYRVLKPGGRLVCQTPYAALLTKTFEEPMLQSASQRAFFYGQEDHVRLFGLDIEQCITNAGFRGRLAPHAEILSDVDPEAFGVNEKEPFFDFIRP